MSLSPALAVADTPIQIRLSEVIGALSYALDITEGRSQGHAARTCMLGMRLAGELRLCTEQSSALFYGSLLKDVGSVFHRTAKIAKGMHGVTNQAKELMALRSERGAKIAAQMQLPPATADAIGALDEHWDGRGHPQGLKGEQIPLLARILSLAQTTEGFIRQFGLDTALEMARDRSGTWFEPALVNLLVNLRRDTRFWEEFKGNDPRRRVAAFEPEDKMLDADAGLLDHIAQGFAQVIDAKSPWTFRHSEGVAEISVGIANVMGFDALQCRYIRRAALLHDVGKLGISNQILDKPGKLTDEEMAEMRKHSRYTYEILMHVTGFRDLADLAASHHERLDGKGYHRGLNAEQLSTPARILAVADMYEALASKRPYRQDLSPKEVMSILTQYSGPAICPEVFTALKNWLAFSEYQPVKLAA